MRDAAVEGVMQNGTPGFKNIVSAEILPKAK